MDMEGSYKWKLIRETNITYFILETCQVMLIDPGVTATVGTDRIFKQDKLYAAYRSTELSTVNRENIVSVVGNWRWPLTEPETSCCCPLLTWRSYNSKRKGSDGETRSVSVRGQIRLASSEKSLSWQLDSPRGSREQMRFKKARVSVQYTTIATTTTMQLVGWFPWYVQVVCSTDLDPFCSFYCARPENQQLMISEPLRTNSDGERLGQSLVQSMCM